MAGAMWRRIVHYVKHDLREFANPSAMPNPPGYLPPPRRTWRKFGEVSARGHPHFDRPQAFHQFCFAMGLTRDPGD